MTRAVLTSPWIPAEWVRAHGLEPCGIWFLGTDIPALPAAGTCEFAQRTLQLVERDPNSLFVFSSHCDQMRRAFDTLENGQRQRAFLFNLPGTLETQAATRIYTSELDRLSACLINQGGHKPGAEHLRAAMEQASRARSSLLEAAPGARGRHFMELLSGRREVSLVDPASSVAMEPGLVPLALLGGPMTEPNWVLNDMIEQLGGWIAVKGAEPGERNLWRDPGEEDQIRQLPYEALPPLLARSYLNHIVDVFQRPNTRLYSWLGQRLRQRSVRGILLWHYTWCDLWRAEAQSLREAFGLPVLALDAANSPGEWPRMRTRIEAFLELLR